MAAPATAPQQKGLLTYENGILVLLGFTFGLIFFDRNAVGVLTPFILEDLQLSNTQLGMLSSMLALAWAISAYAFSAWSDRRGARKPFILVSILVFSACSALSGLAGSFGFLLLARIVMGVAEGPFLPICLSVMNQESSPHRRGMNAGIMQNVFAALLGTTLAPIVLTALASVLDWRLTFFMTGIPGLICAFLVWKFMREPRAIVNEEAQVAEAGEKPVFSALGMLKEQHTRLCPDFHLPGVLVPGHPDLYLCLSANREGTHPGGNRWRDLGHGLQHHAVRIPGAGFVRSNRSQTGDDCLYLYRDGDTAYRVVL